MLQAFLAKFYEAFIIALAAFLLLALLGFGIQSWRVSHWKTIAENVELKCDQEKNDIHDDYKEKAAKKQQAYQEALTKRQESINQLSADYEQAKAEQKTKVEYVTRTVQKIVERPVYFNSCIDDDGLSELNSLIKSRNPGQSDAAMPAVAGSAEHSR